jgi:hypothetical protein
MKNTGNGWMLLASAVYFAYLASTFYRPVPKWVLGISLGTYCLVFAGYLVFMYVKATHGVWYDAGKVIFVAFTYALNFALCMYFITRIPR